MGLFSWLRRKKKKEQEVKLAGIGRNVGDPNVRKAFYEQCAELIDAAVMQSEEAKNEYGLVTTYLSDVQKVTELSGESKALVMSAAGQILALEKEKEKLGKKEPAISESQKAFFSLHEGEMNKTIKWLYGEEEIQREIESKLRYLEGEKATYRQEHEDCDQKNAFLRKLMIGMLAGILVFFLLFFWLSYQEGTFLQVPFLLTVIVGLIFSMYILVTTRKNTYRLKVADQKRNKVIEVENKVKLRYVNCSWGVDYAYEKYHTTSAGQLEMMWKEYLRIRAEEERFRVNERQQELQRSTIIRELRKRNVTDAGIWVLQPQALLSDKEMVEVRHSLNVRRQKLRDHIDYNEKQKDQNEDAFLNFVRMYPEYVDEVKPYLVRYRLLKKLSNRNNEVDD